MIVNIPIAFDPPLFIIECQQWWHQLLFYIVVVCFTNLQEDEGTSVMCKQAVLQKICKKCA